jgi:methionyl-tRNA formyltransferase
MRVVFMGTPAAAVPTLRALANEHDVVAVYTRPDKPRGRGLQVESSPVKLAAEDLSLEIIQPRRLRKEAERLAGFTPDAIVVVAYGAILPADVLAAPKLGCVNVHFSLLPRWRGAAPVERAILTGDAQTGVTTMLMDEGLDTGPILLTETVDIGPDDTSGSMRQRLAMIGAPLLVRTLDELGAGTITPQAQAGDGATYADKIEADEAELDPSASSAVELERKVRAFDPAPGTFLPFRGKRLKVWKASVEEGDGERGTFVDGAVQTPAQRLRLLEVQPEGKRRMSGADFMRGYRPKDGEPIG